MGLPERDVSKFLDAPVDGRHGAVSRLVGRGAAMAAVLCAAGVAFASIPAPTQPPGGQVAAATARDVRPSAGAPGHPAGRPAADPARDMSERFRTAALNSASLVEARGGRAEWFTLELEMPARGSAPPRLIRVTGAGGPEAVADVERSLAELDRLATPESLSAANAAMASAGLRGLTPNAAASFRRHADRESALAAGSPPPAPGR